MMKQKMLHSTYDPASKLFFILVSSFRSPESPTSPNRVTRTSASVPAPRLLPVNTVTLYLFAVHIHPARPWTQYTTHAHKLLLLHPINGLFFRTTWVSRYQKGKTSLDLNESRDDGVQLNHTQTICTSPQMDNHTNTSSPTFYRPDTLPDAKSTVSKHWRHHFASIIV